ncbi:biotin transporter BioY [Candidatus Dependentiae bacterium]|nr:biotin transporter BioY [Candidatus Dependentiae bacterium]
MQKIAVFDKNYRKRYLFFKWRYSLSFVNMLALAFAMACVTGLLAQIKIYFPWTPVPITGQTFAVLLAGVLLGRWWGGVSMSLYLLLGMIGIPWFVGMNSGFSYILGPTGGYLIGFILAALFIGYFTDRYIKSRSLFSILGLMIFANFILIYGAGLLHLGAWLYLVKGSRATLWELLGIGFIPFIIGDVTKIAAASALAKVITPKESYNGDLDIKKAKKSL